MSLALSDEPDVLTRVGLGKVDEVVPHPQQRAVLKLFTKFSGMDAPEQVATREDWCFRQYYVGATLPQRALVAVCM